MARPNYIKCIRHSHEEKKRESWCGRVIDPFEFAFVNIDHAAYVALEEGFNIPCQKCVKEVTRILRLKGNPAGG